MTRNLEILLPHQGRRGLRWFSSLHALKRAPVLLQPSTAFLQAAPFGGEGAGQGLGGSRAPCRHPRDAGQPPVPRAASAHGPAPCPARPTPRRPATKTDGRPRRRRGVPGGRRWAPGRAEAEARRPAPPAVRAVARDLPAVGARAAAAPCRTRPGAAWGARPRSPAEGKGPLRERAGPGQGGGPRPTGMAGDRARGPGRAFFLSGDVSPCLG